MMLTEKLMDAKNSLISVFHPFANICLHSMKFETNGLSVFRLDLFDNDEMGIQSLLNIQYIQTLI